MTAESFIVCDNLVRIYKVGGHDVVALQGLDMAVRRGELLGVVGVSGSGKTTLMNILGGLDRPTAGRVWVDGKDLLKMTDGDLNRYRLTCVGFLWQQSARNLLPYLNAQENVEYPLTLAGVFGRRKSRTAERLLEAVDLMGRRTHRLSELSGGEQQRVAIAVALANDPSLLLADEPTGEVDGATAEGIYRIFRDLQVEFGLTTLIVSHDAGIARHVDRIISVRDGKVSTEMVRQENRLREEAASGQDRTGGTAAPGSTENTDEPAPQHIELTVVDSAGRLQIPKDLRERLGIQDRVLLEETREGVLVRPVETNRMESMEELVDRLEQARKASGWRRLGRWLRGERSHGD